MLTINSSPIDILLALYPEIHYRFRLFKFSRYYRREPEIVVDMPGRSENGEVPVLLLVKDAHLFPIRFTKPLMIEFRGEKHRFSTELQLPADIIEQPWWWTVFELKNIPVGAYRAWGKLSYHCRGRERKITNHNFPGLTDTPLFINCAAEPLPRPEGCLIGDIHCHSSATADQVEFGAPLKPLARMTKAMGLDFAGVTDHSYDLDDDPEDYLAFDPNLTKWRDFLTEVGEINADSAGKYAHIIPGQEITARNTRRRNVHLLLFGGDRLFRGSGDSAEKWFKTASEHSIEEILSTRHQDTIAAAAHPWEKVRLLQRLLLRRGNWTGEDFLPGIAAAQLANGREYRGIENGLKRWRALLRQGRRLSLWAGNDAHGNFNRYRQVKLPMWNLWEHQMHTLGAHRTGIYSPEGIHRLWDGLKSGATYITDGPGLDLNVNGVKPGGTTEGGLCRIEIGAITSEEFAPFKQIELIAGEINGSINRIQLEVDDSPRQNFDLKLDLRPGFIHAAARTLKGNFSATSAVYIK